ncbi:hypothetical protein [Pendulispora albinea]|uniref:Uncharacterized protein n=1 Tax=Pendulispora albinea TaxID=2741071 RepID=A0ABZ2M481_9BACT
MRNKTEILGELRTMLRDIFTAKAAGETHVRLARAHGYVDGYMRAMLETGLATRGELVEMVATERERAAGPAIRPIYRSDSSPSLPPEAFSDGDDSDGETAAA